jgi:hypothetical protein
MSDVHEVIELEIVPIPPDTIASGKEEILLIIESLLRDGGQGKLLDDGKVQVQVEQTFPTDEIIKIGLSLLSAAAMEAFKALILPGLKRKFEVRQRPKSKRKPARRRK